MNIDTDLNKKEGTIVSQSIMSLLSIIIFAIGASLVTSGILFLFSKIIGLDTKITIGALLENEATIPDFFSNIISYSVCRIILAGLSIPVVFFLAIRDRFKGSYMNLVDLKKYKIILCLYVIVYTIICTVGYNMYFNHAIDKYVGYNAVIQENKADERGYFNEGVKKIEVLPKVVLFVVPITGIIAIYVTMVTAESTNKRYLNQLMQNNIYYYEQQENLLTDTSMQNQAVNNPQVDNVVEEQPPSNIFY